MQCIFSELKDGSVYSNVMASELILETNPNLPLKNSHIFPFTSLKKEMRNMV